MDIEKLNYIAEALQTALLEKVAISDILDFTINVIHDDNKIEIFMMKNTPIKSIEVTLNIKRVSSS